jgi:hypothetical protein
MAVDVPRLMDNAARCAQDAWTTLFGVAHTLHSRYDNKKIFIWFQGKITRQAEEPNMSIFRF